MLEGQKVITASEMKRVETISIDAGADAEAYMKQAAFGIATQVQQISQHLSKEKKITLLIGKGNNGGDAFCAGCYLIEKGYEIVAYLLLPLKELTPLSQKFGSECQKKGGRLIHLQTDDQCLVFGGIILDGIFGTGFSGKPKGLAAQVIEKANQSKIPIVAIDIPSGLNGDNGQADGPCIEAYQTIYLGLPKAGFFYGNGYNYIGRLSGVDFGMDPSYLDQAHGVGYLINESAASNLKPKILRNRHKYQSGYVLTIGGSKGMGGAAILAAHASLRAGAGITRLFHPEGMEMDLVEAPVEVIKAPWKEIYQEAKRAKSAVIGPGLGKAETVFQFLEDILQKLSIPLVIDADALYFLAKHPKIELPKSVILTPHHQEMLRLLGREQAFDKEEEFHANCQAFVEEKQCTLVLKGAPTWVFHPKTSPLIIPRGDPGMATAGAGDVLSGVLGAMLAQGLSSREAAVFGVFIHGLAGELAAKEKTSYSLIATDLIEFLPKAFALL